MSTVKDNARHDIRIKVSRGGKAVPGKLISVALRPTVRMIGDEKNLETVLAYWHGEMFAEQVISALKPLDKEW